MKPILLFLSTMLIVTPSLSDDSKWIQVDIEQLQEQELFRGKIDSGVEITCHMEISDLRHSQGMLPAVSIILSKRGVFPFAGRIEQVGRFSVFKENASEKYNYVFSGIGIGIDFATGFGWKEAGKDVREFMIAWPDDGTIRYAVDGNLKNVIIEQHSNFQPRYWILSAVGLAGQIRCISTEI